MAAGDPLQAIDVSIGKPPRPKTGPLAFSGTGGTAVVYHDCRDYGRLMALCGHTLAEWSAVYPPGLVCESTDDKHKDWIANLAGSISVKFLRAKIMRVSHVGGAVEVTLNYDAMQRLPPGGNVLQSTGGPLATTTINNSRSNIKNN